MAELRYIPVQIRPQELSRRLLVSLTRLSTVMFKNEKRTLFNIVSLEHHETVFVLNYSLDKNQRLL